MEFESFLLEAYKQDWEYRRFIEDLRVKHLQAYLLLIGTFVTVLSIITKDKGQTFDELLKDAATFSFLLFGSFFLFAYGFILTMFLVAQKRGYEEIRQSNDLIHNWFAHKNNEKALLKNITDPSSMRLAPWSPSHGWLLLVAILHPVFLLFTLTVGFRSIWPNDFYRTGTALLLSALLLLWERRYLVLMKIPKGKEEPPTASPKPDA